MPANERTEVRVYRRRNLFIVVASDYLHASVVRLSRAYRAQRARWMLTQGCGEGAWVGPVFDPRVGPCFECMATQLQQGRALGLDVGIHRAPQRRSSYIYTPAREEDWIGMIRVRAGRTFGPGRHVARLPSCSICGRAGNREEKSRRDLLRLWNPYSGPVWALADNAFHCKGVIASFMGVVAMPVAGSYVPVTVVGKGFSEHEALSSCLGEAAERLSTFFRRDVPLRWAAAKDLPSPVFTPKTLQGFSEQQYGIRTEWNDAVGFPWIPHRLSADQVIAWVRARSLLTHGSAWLPAQHCFLGFPADESATICVADTIGCAAGATHHTAVYRALLELVERDAITLWWYCRQQKPEVCTDDSDIDRVRTLLARRGRSFCLLDLTTDLGVPVCAAISANRAGGSVLFGFGADTSMHFAARRATAELGQMTGAPRALMRPHAVREKTGEAVFRDWLAYARIQAHPWLQPGEARDATVSLGVETPTALARHLYRKGYESFSVSLTRSDIGVPAVRVVCPGLCNPCHRLGFRRLARAARGMSLNPIPFFL